MLKTLDNGKGKILDDDSVIASLHTLKRKAFEIGQKLEENNRVIGEIEAVSQQYMPLSQTCSNIYFTLDSLSQVHFLYQYSLPFFMDILQSVLNGNARLEEQGQQVQKLDHGQRLSIINSDLFRVVYCRVARGMLNTDRLTFALLLCLIYLDGLATETNLDHEL